ncbi:MAG: hypothetical protein H5U40_01650 [Polyangiaceae bacterium]|nr:hypothetical protein [Polyangiaceae bacterium]
MGAEKQPWKELYFTILRNVVDKLVIGLIVAFVVFQINKHFEEHKAETALQSEVKKTRIERIAEIASAMGVAESKVLAHGKMLDDLDRARRDARAVEASRLEAAIATDRQATVLALRAFRDVLDRNRFWLNDASYARIKRHAGTLLESVEQPSATRLQRIGGTHPNIDDVLADLAHR